MRPFHRRHHDDKIFDEFDLKPEFRYKTSGLSGDEWRVSYVLTIKRKGTVLFQRSYHTPQDAVAHMPWLMRTMLEMEGDDDGFRKEAWVKRIDDDEKTCAQPGCAESAAVQYKFKEIFAPDGEGPLPKAFDDYVTGFCSEHSTRGNCGREDSDNNYEKLSGKVVEPDPKMVKPSAFGGVFVVDDES
jgi:hypothetical protein